MGKSLGKLLLRNINKDDLILIGILFVAMAILVSLSFSKSKAEGLEGERGITATYQPEQLHEIEKMQGSIQVPIEKKLLELGDEEQMKLLLENAHQVLRYQKFLEENTWAKEAGFKFFLSCALNPEALRSFRAQCWSQAQALYYDLYNKELDPSIAPVTILRTARR